MDILELLADADSGLTVSEISQRLKRRMSELFRIIVVWNGARGCRKILRARATACRITSCKLAHRGTPARSLTLTAAPVMHELSTG